MVVAIRTLLGILFILSVTLILLGGFILADFWWAEKVIEPMANDGTIWGPLKFQIATLALTMFCGIILSGVFLTFMKAVIGEGFYAQMGITGGVVGFHAMFPIFIIISLMIGFFLFLFMQFIIYHVPLVIFMGVIAFFTTKTLYRGAEMLLP